MEEKLRRSPVQIGMRWVLPPCIVVACLVALRFLRPGDGTSGGGPKSDAVTYATPAPFDRGAFATLPAERGILVHCGNSMRPATEALAGEFQRRTGIAVRLNFGGSAELLSHIDLSRAGELYICHDPYAEMLEAKGLLDTVATVGSLTPILIVALENPRNITSVRDATAPGVRVAMPDARFATAGRLVRDALRLEGLDEALDANLVMEGRGHNEVAMALLSGQVDVGIVWNFIAAFYRGRLLPMELGLPLPQTRVTLCRLTTAVDAEAAQGFMDLARSEFGQRIFEQYGYGALEREK